LVRRRRAYFMIRVLCAAALVVALAFAVACGDDDDGSDANGGAPQATGADAGNTTSSLPGIDDITPVAPAAGIPPLDPSLEVVTTDSGLRYIDEVVGTGASPAATDVVTVHYTGWLTDGTEFDSSVGGQPVSFPLNRIIAGWTEGLQTMKVGGKRRLIIPAELGYGARGSGQIPPGAVLIFDVERLGIQ
jgi:hypothetical protein